MLPENAIGHLTGTCDFLSSDESSKEYPIQSTCAHLTRWMLIKNSSSAVKARSAAEMSTQTPLEAFPTVRNSLVFPYLILGVAQVH